MAVVLPALNEADALPAVLDAIPRTGRGWRLSKVVVADNGSTDATAAVARARGATVIHEPRRGYGAACLAALAHLRREPPALVAFLDADGSSDPAELDALLAPLVAGDADLTIGSRTLGDREPGALTPVQSLGNRLATFLLGAGFGVTTSDLGPFRAIRWEALERLGMRDRSFGWTVEMQARAARAGLRARDVPVAARRRRAGRSKVAGTLSGAAGAAWKILFTIAKVRFGG